MPLSDKNADTLGCLLWGPGLILGACAGVFVMMSGIVPVALLDAVPILGLVFVLGGAALGAMLAGYLVELSKDRGRGGPRRVELPNTRHDRPPTPEDWGHRDHDDRD